MLPEMCYVQKTLYAHIMLQRTCHLLSTQEGFYEALLYTYIFEYSQADGLV